MELGKDVASHFKAKNFLGCLSIRNGMFVISFSQVVFGLALYCTLHYLHPSLTGVSFFMLGLHVLVGVLGFLGAWKRSVALHVTYMVFYAVSMVFVAMVALDMSELVHFLPKAPHMNESSLFNIETPFITNFKIPKSNILFPFNFYKETFLSTTPTQPLIPDNGKEQLLSKYSVNEIDLHSHKKCKNPSRNYKTASTLDDSPFNADDPNGSMNMDDLNNLKKALRDKLEQSTAPPSSDTDSVQNSLSPPSSNSDSGAQTPDSSKSESKEGDSLYEHIPFLPHPGETEGESEEVSKEEFPPETKDLTPEGKSEVVVMYKMQKRSVKLAFSAFLLVSLLFYFYSYWVAMTFALNKCTCLDELSNQPDQFSPLID